MGKRGVSASAGLAWVVFATAKVLATMQGTWRVSVDSSGAQGNSYSSRSSISGDGRFVSFYSPASNLVPGDTNFSVDVFVHDRRSGTTTRVSVDSSGTQGNDSSYLSSISGNGRCVALVSFASNLVPGDTNNHPDVFVHDIETGTTMRASVDSSGAQSNDCSSAPTISPDGRFVAFHSDATNLVPGDTNEQPDVFVHDRLTSMTTRVSVHSSGAEGNGDSYKPAISVDGRFVSFQSGSSNLVPDDTNGWGDVFVHDRQSGTTLRVSLDSAGTQANSVSGIPSISGDGRLVAFESFASNLVPDDTNGLQDVLVRDLETGATTRVSVGSSGAQGNGFSHFPSICGDGRFVAFWSEASNLVPGDTNVAWDVLVHDLATGTTTRASVDSSGTEGNRYSIEPAISGDGRFVTFYGASTNLVPGDTNGWEDGFVHGPFLTLEARPEIVTTGSTITLTTWTGQAGGPVLLAAVELNGSSLFLPITSTRFDASGLWTLYGTVPPGLSGNVVTFVTLGIAPTGDVEISNLEPVTFQ